MKEQRLIDWEMMRVVRLVCAKCQSNNLWTCDPEVCQIWFALPEIPKPDILDEITKSEVGLKRSNPNKKG